MARTPGDLYRVFSLHIAGSYIHQSNGFYAKRVRRH